MGLFGKKKNLNENEWGMCLKEITAFLSKQSETFKEQIGANIGMVISPIQNPKTEEEKKEAEGTARVTTVYLRLHKQTRLRLFRIINKYFPEEK